MCAKILLRVRVQDSRVRLLDFRKANLEGMRRELGDVDWAFLGLTLHSIMMGISMVRVEHKHEVK